MNTTNAQETLRKVLSAVIPSTIYERFNMGKRLTTEQFIKKAKKVHGDTYDYSEGVQYR